MLAVLNTEYECCCDNSPGRYGVNVFLCNVVCSSRKRVAEYYDHL